MTVIQMPEKGQAQREPAKAGSNSRGSKPSANPHANVKGSAPANARASEAQLRYLRLGLDQPGGKLPLFDRKGQEIKAATIKSCIEKGWAEPWFSNPVKPDWLVCRLTEEGRGVAASGLS